MYFTKNDIIFDDKFCIKYSLPEYSYTLDFIACSKLLDFVYIL